MPPGSNIQEFTKPQKNVLKLDLKREREKEKSKASKFGDLVSQDSKVEYRQGHPFCWEIFKIKTDELKF